MNVLRRERHHRRTSAALHLVDALAGKHTVLDLEMTELDGDATEEEDADSLDQSRPPECERHQRLELREPQRRGGNPYNVLEAGAEGRDERTQPAVVVEPPEAAREARARLLSVSTISALARTMARPSATTMTMRTARSVHRVIGAGKPSSVHASTANDSQAVRTRARSKALKRAARPPSLSWRASQRRIDVCSHASPRRRKCRAKTIDAVATASVANGERQCTPGSERD